MFRMKRALNSLSKILGKKLLSSSDLKLGQTLLKTSNSSSREALFKIRCTFSGFFQVERVNEKSISEFVLLSTTYSVSKIKFSKLGLAP